MSTTKTRTVLIKWVLKGTREWNGTCPPDERLETDSTLEEIRADAEAFAEDGGYSLDEFECWTEEV